MLSSDFCPLKWGDTADSERVNAGMRGAIFEMKNISRTDHKTPLDGRSVFVVVAKNATGGALNARQCVILKSTDAGFSIEDDTTTGEIPDGVVDPHLASAGVADGDCCLVIVGGPCEFITDGAGALAFNDVLVTSTAGKVVKQTAAPPTRLPRWSRSTRSPVSAKRPWQPPTDSLSRVCSAASSRPSVCNTRLGVACSANGTKGGSGNPRPAFFKNERIPIPVPALSKRWTLQSTPPRPRPYPCTTRRRRRLRSTTSRHLRC